MHVEYLRNDATIRWSSSEPHWLERLRRCFSKTFSMIKILGSGQKYVWSVDTTCVLDFAGTCKLNQLSSRFLSFCHVRHLGVIIVMVTMFLPLLFLSWCYHAQLCHKCPAWKCTWQTLSLGQLCWPYTSNLSSESLEIVHTLNDGSNNELLDGSDEQPQ